MIICDHDGVGDRLRHNIVQMIFDGEDDLESKLLVLVSTVASNSHWKFDLH
jgi:hypothetical protein